MTRAVDYWNGHCYPYVWGRCRPASFGPKAQYRSHADRPGYDRMKMYRTYRTRRILSSPRILPA